MTGLRVTDRAAPILSAAVAVAVIVVGLTLGAPVAGGSDSYGYVSQAHLWATGRMREELRLASEVTPAISASALVPLGYKLAPDRESMVPTYAPGLPLVMAVFERVAGRSAVFWVVPLLGGVAVWATYLLARRATSPFAGALAAVLLATSPAFLLQLTAAPMSDVPATAWWTLALALLLVESGATAKAAAGAAAASGVAAGLAILTRPNLVPLAVVPGLFLLWRARSSASDRRRLILFGAPVALACLAVAAINDHLHGGPLRSGYNVRGLFGFEHALPNLARYPVLLTVMQTPLIWLAAAAPWLARRLSTGAAIAAPTASSALISDPHRDGSTAVDARAVTAVAAAFVVAVFACYLCYPIFDAYYTLRFLLPGMPALMAMLAFTLTAAPARWRWRVPAAIAVTAIVVARGLAFAEEQSAFYTRGELKYAVAGEEVARRLPERAVLLAMQHSGSVRYYSGRDIVRYDLLEPERLDRVVKRLQRLGYRPYFLLDEWEVQVFRDRFANRSLLGTLDWPPSIELAYVKVRVWDPAERDPRRGGREPTTVVPWPYPIP